MNHKRTNEVMQKRKRILPSVIGNEPSINDVSFEGEGGGCQKRDFEAIFRAKTEATGGGRGV